MDLSPAVRSALQLLLARARVETIRADVTLLEQLAAARLLLEAAAKRSYVAELTAAFTGQPGHGFFEDWLRSCDADVRRLEARYSSLAAAIDRPAAA